MSTIVGLRGLARQTKFDVGGKSFSTGVTTLLNLDNKRVARDIARHSAIGQTVQAIPAFFQNDDGVVEQGGKVTVRATGLVLDVSAINFTRASGAAGTGAAGTATIGAADATNPRVDTVVVNTTSGAFSVIAGTATAANAGGNNVALGGKAAVPADRIVLAYVIVPPTATNLVQSAVLDARP
jgi:hypothetical protein